ncbi:MAG TPA: hypothetical protein VGI83_01285, partial [Gemmatimonadales bacterium]
IVLASEAFLFKPTDAINYQQGGDNGTPLQKDEPQATNPPGGAVIDYYLKANATGAVTLEIIDSAGTTLETFSSEAPPPQANVGRGGRAGGIPNTTILWRPTPEPFSAAAGMHRVVWAARAAGRGGRGGRGGGGGGRGGGTPLNGTFTVKLTVNGQSYTQPLVVKPDPRGAEGPPAQ